MKRPNFFIVGFAKCGTTSLAKYLGNHPNCFISAVKEPFYFSSDLIGKTRTYTWEEYLQLFEGAGDDHLAVGEASTQYVHSRVAPKKIREFDPQAKIIVMLRNPIDLAYSLHLYRIHLGDETETDFETVWSLYKSREKGEIIPKGASTFLSLDPTLLYLGDHVERLLSVFSREQVMFILYDDFQDDSKKVYEDVLKFLGLPPDDQKEFNRYNVYKSLKSAGWNNFLNSAGDSIGPWLSGLKKIFGIKRLGLLNGLRKMNYTSQPKKPLSPEFRAKLVNEFRPHVEKLSRILDRDLDHWHQ